MLIRIVKMQFRPEEVNSFIHLLEEVGPKIRSFPRCLHMKALQDLNEPSIFFTYSHWEDADALEAYRKSELFVDTWARTKALFAHKAEAWSTHIVNE